MSKKSNTEELTDIIIKNSNHIYDLNMLLATIYLNHIKDNSVHGSSLRREIEAMAAKYRGDLLHQIKLYGD